MPFIDKALLKAAKTGEMLCPDEGEPVVAIYKGYKSEADEKFGGIVYKFLFDVDGVQRDLRTRAKRILARFAYISPGAKLEITRFGEGKEKTYEIKVLKEGTGKIEEEFEEEKDELDGDDPEEATF